MDHEPTRCGDCPTCRLTAIVDPHGHPDRIEYIAELVATVWEVSAAVATGRRRAEPDPAVVMLAALAAMDRRRQASN